MFYIKAWNTSFKKVSIVTHSDVFHYFIGYYFTVTYSYISLNKDSLAYSLRYQLSTKEISSNLVQSFKK